MRYVFVDTAHYIAVFNRHDALHTRASSIVLELYANRDVSFITTDAVLVETLTFFAGRGSHSRQNVAEGIAYVFADPRVTVVPQTPALFDAGLDLYRRRPDKTYSMCDCMSMVVCAERSITDVLSADRDFEQEGLTLLL